MGYIRHDAIVVTSWNREVLELAATQARFLGLEVIGPSAKVTNGISTFLVCPDGSKEGWDESEEFEDRRARFLEYLNGKRYEDRSSCLSWVALAYGSDDRDAVVKAHTWQVPLMED